MKCPICGATTIVVETSDIRQMNVIRRRRMCRNGHRLKSMEAWIPEFKAGRPKKDPENSPMEECGI